MQLACTLVITASKRCQTRVFYPHIILQKYGWMQLINHYSWDNVAKDAARSPLKPPLNLQRCLPRCFYVEGNVQLLQPLSTTEHLQAYHRAKNKA
jgi:hypothetical protein